MRRTLNAVLFAICLTLTISGSWVVLALVAHSNLDDPLCGRNCYDTGVVPAEHITRMDGGQ